jgi:hypothetical protein
MKHIYGRLLLILSATLLAGLSFADERVGRVVLRVVDESGKSVPYKMENCTDSKRNDCTGNFVGLEAAQLPFASYTYILGRSDLVSSHGKIRGKFAAIVRKLG